MEKVRRKETKQAFEKVNEKLSEDLSVDVNGWRHGNLFNGSSNPNAWAYNDEVLSQMPGSHKVPTKIVLNPNEMYLYTHRRSINYPVTTRNFAVQYIQKIPYIPRPPYISNVVPLSNPANLRAESYKIFNLRLHRDQNKEISARFPFQSTSAPKSISHSRRGPLRRQELLIDSHSKVLGYQPGISTQCRFGDMRQSIASEEEESSWTTELTRELNRKKDRLQNSRQLEESDSSSSSFSENLGHSSDSSLVMHKLKFKRHNVYPHNDTLDLGEVEGLCE